MHWIFLGLIFFVWGGFVLLVGLIGPHKWMIPFGLFWVVVSVLFTVFQCLAFLFRRKDAWKRPPA
jgi:hypothetical protein